MNSAAADMWTWRNIPTDFLDRIEVSRGAQSAVYGSYANSGVVNFISRLDEGAPQLNVIAEGGSHSSGASRQERPALRVAIELRPGSRGSIPMAKSPTTTIETKAFH